MNLFMSEISSRIPFEIAMKGRLSRGCYKKFWKFYMFDIYCCYLPKVSRWAEAAPIWSLVIGRVFRVRETASGCWPELYHFIQHSTMEIALHLQTRTNWLLYRFSDLALVRFTWRIFSLKDENAFLCELHLLWNISLMNYASCGYGSHQLAPRSAGWIY